MIELKNVDKRFGRGAVGADDVSLTVDQGEVIALFGPSGSGKTTILHMMGLLLRPDSGEVWLDGMRVDDLPESAAADVRRTKLGFVFQSFGLIQLLSAYENVEVSLRMLGMPRDRERINAALDSVGLGNRAGHRPSEMSGGEQQRVALARAMVHNPRVLFADEPTGELDTNTAAYVLDMFRRASGDGTTVVIATHDPLALEAVDRAYFVRDGTLHEPDRDELQLWLTEGEGGLATRR